MSLRSIQTLFATALLIGLLANKGSACGINWSLAKGHFDGVDDNGTVYYTDKIGELKVDDKLLLPIHILFKSNWENNSSYLGRGWILPLLESRIEQVDENTFKMWMPDGWFKYFWRDSKDKNVLRSGGGWAAQIQGDTITTWADCGWKVVYTRGKIVSLYTPQGNVLTYNYADNNQVSDIRDRGSIILRVKRNQEGEIAGLEMGNKSIALEYEQRPQIQVINGQRLIGAMDKSVSKITQTDGTVKTFEYGTSSTLEPTMKINGERLLTWDPQSKIIKKDGEWAYSIIPNSKNSEANVPIERTNPQNQKEYWFKDEVKGSEINVSSDGVKMVRTWFTSGPLASKPRNITVEKNEHIITDINYVYDEMGRLIRKITLSNQWDFKYQDSKLVAVRKDATAWQNVKDIIGNTQ